MSSLTIATCSPVEHKRIVCGGGRMTYLAYFASILLGFAKKRSRLVETLILVTIWVLSAFASGNADSGIYEARYNLWQSFEGMSEIGWQALVVAGNSLGLDYQMFRCVLVAAELLLLRSAVHRLTEAPAFVFACYMIYPLCLDIVQMRFALAACVAFFGMSFLFERGEGYKRRVLVFVACVAIASTFHFVSLLYLVLLLVPRLRTTGSVIAVPVIAFAFMLLMHWSGLSDLAASVGLGVKYETLRSYDAAAIGKYLLNVALYGVTWSAAFILVARGRGHELRDEALRLNWLVAMTVVPLLLLSADFYRIQQGITLLNLCLISRFLAPEGRLSFTKRNALVILLVVAISLMNLWLYVIGNVNVDTVFWPMFEGNLVLGGF